MQSVKQETAEIRKLLEVLVLDETEEKEQVKWKNLFIILISNFCIN